MLLLVLSLLCVYYCYHINSSATSPPASFASRAKPKREIIGRKDSSKLSKQMHISQNDKGSTTSKLSVAIDVGRQCSWARHSVRAVCITYVNGMSVYRQTEIHVHIHTTNYRTKIKTIGGKTMWLSLDFQRSRPA